jgi:hypothetical protein
MKHPRPGSSQRIRGRPNSGDCKRWHCEIDTGNAGVEQQLSEEKWPERQCTCAFPANWQAAKDNYKRRAEVTTRRMTLLPARKQFRSPPPCVVVQSNKDYAPLCRRDRMQFFAGRRTNAIR